MMYKKTIDTTNYKGVKKIMNCYVGEPLEITISRLMNSGTPIQIKEVPSQIPGYNELSNIRSDRFELAINAANEHEIAKMSPQNVPIEPIPVIPTVTEPNAATE